MPKERRYFQAGHHYHLTHRCHGRSFFFKFTKDRNTYREMLRQRLKRYRTPLLGYCLTCNHVHLLVTATSEPRISELMDALEGDFAQHYNFRKNRSDAFWGGRFHATAVERASHLWNCLIYLELNMVRARAVAHPSEWAWCSFNELAGTRRRYRLIDRNHFAEAFGWHPDSSDFQEHYKASIEQRILNRALQREPVWTESLAAGSKAYVSEIATALKNRRRLMLEPVDDTSAGTWALKEGRPGYG